MEIVKERCIEITFLIWKQNHVWKRAGNSIKTQRDRHLRLTKYILERLLCSDKLRLLFAPSSTLRRCMSVISIHANDPHSREKERILFLYNDQKPSFFTKNYAKILVQLLCSWRLGHFIACVGINALFVNDYRISNKKSATSGE